MIPLHPKKQSTRATVATVARVFICRNQSEPTWRQTMIPDILRDFARVRNVLRGARP